MYKFLTFATVVLASILSAAQSSPGFVSHPTPRGQPELQLTCQTPRGLVTFSLNKVLTLVFDNCLFVVPTSNRQFRIAYERGYCDYNQLLQIAQDQLNGAEGSDNDLPQIVPQYYNKVRWDMRGYHLKAADRNVEEEGSLWPSPDIVKHTITTAVDSMNLPQDMRNRIVSGTRLVFLTSANRDKILDIGFLFMPETRLSDADPVVHWVDQLPLSCQLMIAQTFKAEINKNPSEFEPAFEVMIQTYITELSSKLYR